MSTFGFIQSIKSLPSWKSSPRAVMPMKQTSLLSRQTSLPSIKAKPEEKKMLWGEPIWLFFHTMAEKLNEESFADVKTEFVNIIYMICTNLPCPTCAKHAKSHLDSTNFAIMTTKAQLKQFFCNFHNLVNERKGFALMQMSEADDKYRLANTRNIIYNFMQTFEKNTKTTQLIAEDFHRQRTAIFIKRWLNTNIIHFAP